MPRRREDQLSEFEHVLSMGDKLGDYVDEWIAVVNGKIIATGKDGKEVYKKAKELYPDKRPFIMRVPVDKVMVL
jgi:hypothetical protein